MSMTRQHFVELAAIFRACKYNVKLGHKSGVVFTSGQVIEELQNSITTFCKNHNKRFDVEKFTDACKIER